MSWLVGAAVAAALLVLRGPPGRPPARISRREVDTGSGRLPGPVPRLAGPVSRRLTGGGSAAGTDPDLAVLVTDVAARLRSGADPVAAWSAALGRPVAPGGPVVDDLARGSAHRPEAVVVVVAGRLAAELGAPLAPLLDGVARGLAAQAEADGDRRAALAGPRATARVLTWLPVLGVVLGTAVGADPVEVLLDGGLGSTALAAGAVLVGLGRAWTARLARSAASAGRPR